MNNVKALTEPGMKKLFGIIRDEIKNNSQGGAGSDLESQLSEYFYSKQELLDIFSGSGGTDIPLPGRPSNPAEPSIYTPTPLEYYSDYSIDDQLDIITLKQYNSNSTVAPSGPVIVPRSYEIDGKLYKTIIYGSVYKLCTNIQSIVIEDGVKFGASCQSMFYGIGKIPIVIGKVDTSDVVDMSYMFARGYTDTSSSSSGFDLDLSSFDTSNVTNMESMFYAATFSKLNIQSFNTSKVTNMLNMFKFTICDELDLSLLDLSNVSSTLSPFMGRGIGGGIKKIIIGPSNLDNIASFAIFSSSIVRAGSGGSGSEIQSLMINSRFPDHVVDIDKLFNLGHDSVTDYGISVVNIEIGDMFDTSKLTSLAGLFRGCTDLKSINWINARTSNVTDISKMYSNTGLTDVDLSFMDTSSVRNMTYLFSKCSLLRNIDLSNNVIMDGVDCSYMFNYAGDMFTRDTTIKFPNELIIGDASYMFSESTMTIFNPNLLNFNAENVQGMFYKCSSMTYVNLTPINVSDNISWGKEMFTTCIKLSSIYIADKRFDGKLEPDGTIIDGFNNLLYAVAHAGSTSGSLVTFTGDNLTLSPLVDLDKIRISIRGGYTSSSGTAFRTLILNNLKIDNDNGKVSLKALLSGAYFSRVEFSMNEFNKVTNISEMFSNNAILKYIDMRFVDLSECIDMSNAFASCTVLDTLLLPSDVKFVYPVNITGMFNSLRAISNINITGVSGTFEFADTIFTTCSNGFNINITNSNIVLKCTNEYEASSNYNAIFGSSSASNPKSITIVDSTIKFCGFGTRMLYGMITVLDAQFELDVINASYMFANTKFSNLKLTGTVTGVTKYMFNGMNSTLDIDLSELAVVSDDMSYMFQNASVTELDLRNFDVRNATNLNYMFGGCTRLTKILVSRDKWIIPSTCTVSNMFYNCGCSSVTYID